MKTDRRLIAEVEQAECEAKQRADAQRRQLDSGGQPARQADGPAYLHPDSDLDAKIKECGKAVRERMGRANVATDKPMIETREQTAGQTVPRRRRRFLNEVSDTPPPPAAETSDSDAIWAEKDRKGYFSGRPGPGRGHTTDGSGAWGNSGRGDGDSDLDLLSELTAAIERRGPRWFDELLKASPVVSAQLLAALRKTEPQPGTPGGQAVRIELGQCLAGIAESIMTRPALGPAADLDLATARSEVKRLRDENDALKRAANDTAPPKPEDKPILPPAPSKEPIECPDCLMRVNIGGRMIEPYSKCKFCGQTYDDTVAKTLTANRPPPDPDERPFNAGAMCITAEPGGGWRPVKSLSIPSIHEAVAGGDRGPFG